MTFVGLQRESERSQEMQPVRMKEGERGGKREKEGRNTKLEHVRKNLNLKNRLTDTEWAGNGKIMRMKT